MDHVVKVSSRSNPNAVAGALAHVVRSSGAAEVQVVGAGALNQAIKAIAIARSYLAPGGVDLACRPTFADVEIDGETRTAIRLTVDAGDAAAAREDHAAGVDGRDPESADRPRVAGPDPAPEPLLAPAAPAPGA